MQRRGWAKRPLVSTPRRCVLVALLGWNAGVVGFLSHVPHLGRWSSCESCEALPTSRARVQHMDQTRRRQGAIGCVPSGETSSTAPMSLKNARMLELWLDARGGEAESGGWRNFEGLADVVLFDEEHGDQPSLLSSQSKRRLVVTEGGKLLDGGGNLAGTSVAIESPKSQSMALSLVGSVDWIQVTCSDWTMIPAENLVSAAGGTPTRIAVELSEPSQVQGAAFALEIGVDALLLRPDHDLWTAAVTARDQRNEAARLSALTPHGTSNTDATSGGSRSGVVLSVGKVTGTKEGGVGDRVCVDLIQNLSAGEGMLVGSSAKMLALVHAETFETGFVPARPFRINAGPVHSYALLADGSTKYMSELCAGDQVLVVDYQGEGRAVAIGRLKVERRPMIMVEFQGDSGSKGQLFLQQAETVRLISPTTSDESDAGARGEVSGWRPLSVTDIEGGEALLFREASRGTHVGKAIDAVVTES